MVLVQLTLGSDTCGMPVIFEGLAVKYSLCPPERRGLHIWGTVAASMSTLSALVLAEFLASDRLARTSSSLLFRYFVSSMSMCASYLDRCSHSTRKSITSVVSRYTTIAPKSSASGSLKDSQGCTKK